MQGILNHLDAGQESDAYLVAITDLLGEMRGGSCTKSAIQLSITLYFALHDSLRDTRPLIWYAVVLLLPLVLQLVAIGVPTLFGLATISFVFPVSMVFGSLFVAGLGEELGWRGFALPRLQARQQAFAASLLLGVLWGLWHLPLRIAMGLPLTSLGLVIFIGSVLSLTGISVLLTWVYNNTRGSLFLMVLFHGVFDIVSYTILAPGNTWIVPILYLILLWVVVTLVVVRAGAARLSRTVALA